MFASEVEASSTLPGKNKNETHFLKSSIGEANKNFSRKVGNLFDNLTQFATSNDFKTIHRQKGN
jgi:hypothetical protein